MIGEVRGAERCNRLNRRRTCPRTKQVLATLPKRSFLNLFVLLFGVFILLAGMVGRDQLSSDTVPCAGDRTSTRGVPRHSRERPAFDPDCIIEVVAQETPGNDADAPPLSTRVARLPSEPADYGVKVAR